MNPKKEIDNLIAKNPDWRGKILAKIRKIILETDPEIIEDWEYKGSPVWSLGGIICVGNIFKNKVQLIFQSGAAIDDPDKLFNAGLYGKKWRYIDFYEDDEVGEIRLKKTGSWCNQI